MSAWICSCIVGGVWLLAAPVSMAQPVGVDMENAALKVRYFSPGDVPLERLGLDAATEYVAFDFWGNKLLPSVQGRLELAVPGESCVVLAVRPRATHPQVISTSRHVTQGIVELADEKWDSAAETLSGKVKVVGGDPCELHICTGANHGPAGVELSGRDKAAGVKTKIIQDGPLARIRIESPSSREISWSVRFR